MQDQNQNETRQRNSRPRRPRRTFSSKNIFGLEGNRERDAILRAIAEEKAVQKQKEVWMRHGE